MMYSIWWTVRELFKTYRDRAQLSPAHTENNSSLSIDFVLREGASLSILSAGKQQKSV